MRIEKFIIVDNKYYFEVYVIFSNIFLLVQLKGETI